MQNKKNKLMLLVGGVFMTCLLNFACGSEDAQVYIKQLGSENYKVADAAATNLMSLGKKAIQPLIENYRNKSEYHGRKIYNPKSSQLQTKRVSIGIASLYLIEAIIKNNLYFALNPVLLYKGEEFSVGNTDEKTKIAAEAYRKWFERNANLDLKSIQSEKQAPLAETGLHWYGASCN